MAEPWEDDDDDEEVDDRPPLRRNKRSGGGKHRSPFEVLAFNAKAAGIEAAAHSLMRVFKVELPFLRTLYAKVATKYDGTSADALMGIIEWLARSGGATLVDLYARKGGALDNFVEGTLEAIIRIVREKRYELRRMNPDEQGELVMKELRKDAGLPEEAKPAEEKKEKKEEVKPAKPVGMSFLAACSEAAKSIKDEAAQLRSMSLINEAFALVDERGAINADPSGFWPNDVMPLVLHAATLQAGQANAIVPSMQRVLASRRKPFSLGGVMHSFSDGVGQMGNPLGDDAQARFAASQQASIEQAQRDAEALAEHRAHESAEAPVGLLDRMFNWFKK